MSMESSIILAIQKSLSSDVGRALIGFCARWVIYLYVPFIFVARISKGMRHAVVEAAWTAALAFAVSTTLASLIGRVRPYLAVAGVQAIVPPNIQAGSFPSSHTAVAIGIATALSFYNVPLGVAAFLMAMTVAFGRVAAGMHYPTDVLGGAVVGVLAFIIVRIGHAAVAKL
jgi:undecaprenyl-diphosphatase